MAASACTPDVVSPPSQALSSDHPVAADLAPPVSVYANEPLGFTHVLENSASGLPGTIGFTSALDGFWRMNASPNTKAITDTSAPCSPPGVWSATYPSGLTAGSGPVTLWGQISKTSAPEARQWYLRACLKVGRSGGFQNQPSGTKMMIISLSGDPALKRCSVIPIIQGDGTVVVKSSWNANVTFECAGLLPTVKFMQLPGVGRPIKSDVWQVHEWIVDVGDVDQSNGRFRWWIDGKLVLDRKNKFRTRANGLTHGVYWWRWTPTWGGMVGVRTRPDDYQIDDIYVSSFGKP